MQHIKKTSYNAKKTGDRFLPIVFASDLIRLLEAPTHHVPLGRVSLVPVGREGRINAVKAIIAV